MGGGDGKSIGEVKYDFNVFSNRIGGSINTDTAVLQ